MAKPSFIYSTYRPSNSSYVSGVKSIENVLDGANPLVSDIVILGDMNIDWGKDDAPKKKLNS